jgi:hypothetical protein
MQRLGLDHAEMLPVRVQQEIQRALYEEWLAGPIGQEMKRRWEHGNSDARIRNVASAWKTTQFNLYGGQIWLGIYACARRHPAHHHRHVQRACG